MKTALFTPPAALAIALLSTLPAHAAFGDVDGSFNSATFEGFTCRNSPTLLSDDSMLVHLFDQRTVSSNPGFRHALARLKPDGSVDRTFGQDGLAQFVVANEANNLLPLGDGRILALSQQRATRLLASGDVDTSYGQGGITEQFFDTGVRLGSASLLPDGTLMVASTFGTEVVFTWFSPEGHRVSTLGNAGSFRVPLEAGEIGYAWTLQANGRVELATYKYSSGVSVPKLRSVAIGNVGIGSTAVTVLPSGVMPSLGIAGWVSNAVKVDGFGGVLIASSASISPFGESRVRLTRYGPDGALDAAFGIGGSIATTTVGAEGQTSSFELPSELWAVPGGGWTMIVDAERHSGVSFTRQVARDKRVLRFTALGRLDSTFPQGKRLDASPLTQNDNGSLLTTHSTLIPGSCTVKRLATDVPRVEATVVEYYHPALNHYFMTIEGLEVGILDNNRAQMGWLRTGKRFGSWAAAAVPGTARLCRFYGDLAAGPNSHFYIPQGPGCEGLQQLEAQAVVGTKAWRLEGIVFSATEAPTSTCPGALAPVYRFYNGGYEQGRDSNHRYSTDPAVSAEMVAKGWVVEGIAFCVPPVSGRHQFIF